MGKQILTRDMTEAEWLAERRKYLGASEVGAALGLNPYKTALDLYKEKIGETEPVDLSDNFAIKIGLKMEPVIADLFAEQTGATVRRDNKIRVADNGFLSASLDRVASMPDGRMAVVEIKTAGENMGQYWDNGMVPKQYYAQIQQQLLITGYEVGFFAAMIGIRDFRVIEVPRNDEYIGNHVELATDFWQNHVVKLVPPEMTVRDLEQIESKSGIVEASESVLKAYDDLGVVKSKIKTLDDQKKELEEVIKLAMGENEVIVHGGKTLATWKSVSKKEYTVKATSYRSFLPKYSKGE